jgi:transcriptional regulator of arginine metabolism
MIAQKKSNLNLSILEAIKKLLANGHNTTQEAIRLSLAKQGIAVNQSKISRLLRKLGAVKKIDQQKKAFYSLPLEPPPPLQNSSLGQLVLDTTANETLIVVRTNPGSASLIARLLDHHYAGREILGTLAGDDTVFVVPKSIKDIKNLTAQIKQLLM